MISGFCSNTIINNPIQNPGKVSFPTLPCYSNQASFKTLYSPSWKLDSRGYKLQCRSRLRKVEAVSGDTKGLKSGNRKKNLAVFVSGGGSNFRSIHEAVVEGSVPAEIVVLVTNKPGMFTDLIQLIAVFGTVISSFFSFFLSVCCMNSLLLSITQLDSVEKCSTFILQLEARN